MFRLRVHSIVDIPDANMGDHNMRRIGEFACATIDKRIGKGISAHDFPMPPYKDNKPVYVSISGYAGRAARTFTGPTISVKQAAKLKRVGRASVRDVRRSSSTKLAAGAIVRSSKTIRFPNWSTFKRAIGQPSYRNLMVTGALRGSFKVIRFGMRSVELGFGSSLQEKKAVGNEKIVDSFDMSPSDERAVAAYVDRIYRNRYK